MPSLMLANDSTAARRRVFFDLRDAIDGITAEPGESTGQPQISTNGGSWTNTGISTLTHIGNGRYYATLDQSAIATAGDRIETRYKSANTVDTPGDSVQVVAFNPFDATALGLSRLDVAVGTRSSHSAADVWAVGARTLTAFSFAVNLSGAAVQAVWDALTSALTTAGSIGKRLADYVTGDVYARLGAPAGASIAADIATRSTLTAAQVDTQLTNSHGTGSWASAGIGGGGAYSVPIHLQDDLAADVPGRIATVRNSDETALIGGPLTSDANGDVTFQLDVGTYKVLVTNSGAYVPLPAQTLVVTGPMATTTYVLTRQGIATPSQPTLCVVFGYMIRPDGLPAANVTLTFALTNAAGLETSAGLLVEVDHVVTVVTDSTGYFQAELVRSVNLVPYVAAQGVAYRIQSPAANLDYAIEVPDQDTVDVAELLPPV